MYTIFIITHNVVKLSLYRLCFRIYFVVVMYVVFYTYIERVHLRVIVVYITPCSSPRATNDILCFIQHNLNLLSSHYYIFYNIAML